MERFNIASMANRITERFRPELIDYLGQPRITQIINLSIQNEGIKIEEIQGGYDIDLIEYINIAASFITIVVEVVSLTKYILNREGNKPNTEIIHLVKKRLIKENEECYVSDELIEFTIKLIKNNKN